MLGYIKTARESEALQAFEDLVFELNAHKHKPHYNQIQPIFVQSLTAMMNSYAQLGANTKAVFGNGTDPYRELLEQGSLDDICRWFHRIIRLITDYLEREMNTKGNSHIARVVEMMEREYSDDISAHSVASD